eukprot:COSAG01_NODE_1718_length_9396_cov_26.510165_9_plen_774_part_00
MARARADSRMPDTELHQAALAGDVLRVSAALLRDGADTEAKDDKDGATPLHCAASSGNLAACAALVEGGADVGARNNYRSTPLHCAAASDHEAICEDLLRSGADVGARDENDATPLQQAAFNGHEAACGALVRGGADVGGADGDTPADWAKRGTHAALAQLLCDPAWPPAVDAQLSTLTRVARFCVSGTAERVPEAVADADGADTGGKPVCVYVLECTGGDTGGLGEMSSASSSWVVEQRFSEFDKLDKALVGHGLGVKGFPSKITPPWKAKEDIESERVQTLDAWMQAVQKAVSTGNSKRALVELLQFLQPQGAAALEPDSELAPEPESVEQSAGVAEDQKGTLSKRLPTAGVTIADKVVQACQKLHKNDSLTSLVDGFTNSEVGAGIHAIGQHAPVVGTVLKVVDSIHGLIKARKEIPGAIEDFFRQVATVNRVMRDVFVGMEQLPAELARHMKRLQQELDEGEMQCRKTCERWKIASYVMAESDTAALAKCTTGVEKYLGLCVAEVAADAVPRLHALCAKFKDAAVFTQAEKDEVLRAAATVASAAAEEGVPPEDTAAGSEDTGEEQLRRTKTRAQVRELRKEISALKKAVATKQDAVAPASTDQDMSVAVGGCSLQAQAQAQATTSSTQSASAGANQRADTQNGAERIAFLEHQVQCLVGSVQEVRERTGLELSLPDAVQQIKEMLDLDVAMKPLDVLEHAREEYGVAFEPGWNLRLQVQAVCNGVGIMTGWTEAAAAETPPTAPAAESDRAALLFGDSGDTVDEADLL